MFDSDWSYSTSRPNVRVHNRYYIMAMADHIEAGFPVRSDQVITHLLQDGAGCLSPFAVSMVTDEWLAQQIDDILELDPVISSVHVENYPTSTPQIGDRIYLAQIVDGGIEWRVIRITKSNQGDF